MNFTKIAKFNLRCISKGMLHKKMRFCATRTDEGEFLVGQVYVSQNRVVHNIILTRLELFI